MNDTIISIDQIRDRIEEHVGLRAANECTYCHRQIPTNLCGVVHDQYGASIGICCLACKADRESDPMITTGHWRTMLSRTDLLEELCEFKRGKGISWAGVAHEFKDSGQQGGSALDRRMIAELMADLERRWR